MIQRRWRTMAACIDLNPARITMISSSGMAILSGGLRILWEDGPGFPGNDSGVVLS